jgi:hypothetical protein
MQLHGFNLHSLLCYYNDAEVVKKNVRLARGKSINSYDEPIRNLYGEGVHRFFWAAHHSAAQHAGHIYSTSALICRLRGAPPSPF